MKLLKLEDTMKARLMLVLHTVFIMCWLSVLADTDALHSVYSLIAIVSVFCLGDNYSHNRLGRVRHWGACLLFAVIFSALTALANYPVFLQVRDPVHFSPSTNMLQNGLNLVCCLVGGVCVTYNILTALLARLPLAAAQESTTREHPGRVFLLVFLSVAAINLVYLFLDEYPGHVTPDSLDQITQGYTGNYINVHPFWHTFAIKGILSLGYGIFGSANAAVALFSLLQLLAMAAIFGYVIMTLYQVGIPRWCLGLCWAVYGLMPYNIALSIAMWKDVPFSAAALVMTVSLYRILTGMDKRGWISWLLFGASCIAFCLGRTTGVPAMAVMLVLFTPCLFRDHKRLLGIMAMVLILAVLLTGPVLTAIGVQETDFTEALSIPLQQLARVVYDGCPLTEEETALLGRIFDLEEIPELYSDWLADPIKLEVRENDIGYLRENLMAYARMWARLAVKYPGEFIKAWVDQTKGYWNGGYDYHQYAEMVQENSYGMEKTGGVGIISLAFYLYFGLFRHSIFLQPLNAIGLHVWLLAVCLLVNAVKGRKEALLSIPALTIILSLLVGTPVFAEFRYAYAVFLVCPLVLPLTLFSGNRQMR